MNYTQDFECTQWQFRNIPEFVSGKMRPLFANCGCGLTNADSFMHIFDETDSESVLNYAKELEENGFEKTFENSICGNMYFQFTVPEGQLYVQFMKKSGLTRITLDACNTTDIAHFGYSDFTEINSDTVFAQYSLHYDKMIKGTTCDCGMNYVYRLHDNSLIIIDGGEFEQATDIAVEDYMKFLHEITNTQKGEKIIVSLWLCTHPHNDHCDFMAKVIRFHSDEVVVERATFNFPDAENVRHSPTVQLVKDRLLEKYPEIEYTKFHAGTKFNIANAELEFLVVNDDSIDLCYEGDDPFTYTNATSSVFTVKADGLKTLFLADCGDVNGSVIIDDYDKEVTDSDFLQAAHHGINSIYNVYERLDTDKLLLPQNRENMDERFPENLEHMCKLYGEENIYFANDATYIFTLENGKCECSQRAHVGVPYDGSEW